MPNLDTAMHNESYEEEDFSIPNFFGYDAFYTNVHEPAYGERKSPLEEEWDMDYSTLHDTKHNEEGHRDQKFVHIKELELEAF